MQLQLDYDTLKDTRHSRQMLLERRTRHGERKNGKAWELEWTLYRNTLHHLCSLCQPVAYPNTSRETCRSMHFIKMNNCSLSEGLENVVQRRSFQVPPRWSQFKHRSPYTCNCNIWHFHEHCMHACSSYFLLYIYVLYFIWRFRKHSFSSIGQFSFNTHACNDSNIWIPDILKHNHITCRVTIRFDLYYLYAPSIWQLWARYKEKVQLLQLVTEAKE